MDILVLFFCLVFQKIIIYCHLQPVLTSEPRRRSSRTGNGPEMPQYATLPLQSDSVDELPLPPTPLNNIENPYRYEAIPERKSRTSSTSMSSSSSGTLFSKIMPNFCRPHAVPIHKIQQQLPWKPIHLFDNIKLILYFLVRNSTTLPPDPD